MGSGSGLPQLGGGLFLSDGGLETTLVFLDGVELPLFAAFVLLRENAGRARLARYYEPYLELAAATAGAGFVLETPTWRASADWAAQLGIDPTTLAALNRDAVALVHEVRQRWAARIAGPIVLNGVIGPRGDGYVPGPAAPADDFAAYHAAQAATLAEAGAEMLSAVTMTTADEALGIARAAAQVDRPVAISFTVETDGRLPDGTALADAIARVDAEAGIAPAYYALNCAHPAHFETVLASLGERRRRIRGLRANASIKSHAELDAATELDVGDAADLGHRYRRLRVPLPALNVLGGCCGTDIRHLRAIRDAWLDQSLA